MSRMERVRESAVAGVAGALTGWDWAGDVVPLSGREELDAAGGVGCTEAAEIGVEDGADVLWGEVASLCGCCGVSPLLPLVGVFPELAGADGGGGVAVASWLGGRFDLDAESRPPASSSRAVPVCRRCFFLLTMAASLPLNSCSSVAISRLRCGVGDSSAGERESVGTGAHTTYCTLLGWTRDVRTGR